MADAKGYAAAVETCALLPGTDVVALIAGRAAAQMLSGMVTGVIPGAPAADGQAPTPDGETPTPNGGSAWPGRAGYSTLLTPKGRMLADLTLVRLPTAEATEAFLAILPPGGAANALDAFRRSLPPRLARLSEVADRVSTLTLLGPGTGAALATLFADGTLAPWFDSALEDDVLILGAPWQADDDGMPWVLRRSGEFGVPACQVVGSAVAVAGLQSAHPGLPRLTSAAAHILRVEAGRPAYGSDMDESTIPIEAGIDKRAIDGAKGCYTGQEVIVRIRDRGHVNRHLRRLTFAAAETVTPGAGLYSEGAAREIGRVTSVAMSPRLGGLIGLGYVRREVEPPAEVRLGAEDGPRVGVSDLGERPTFP